MFHTLKPVILSTTWRHAVLSFTFFALAYFIFVKSSEQANFVENPCKTKNP